MDPEKFAEKMRNEPGAGGVTNGGAANQMPLQVLRDENKTLSVPELLHLLKAKVVSGRELPPQLTSAPWRIPPGSHPQAAVINAILSKSMEVQSSKVPECHGHGDFQDFILSNSSLAVAGLLKVYLQSVGVTDAQVMFGVLLWDAAAREGPDDYEGTPHIWLDVGGHDLDNAHIAFPESGGEAALEYFYKAKSSNSYRREDPLKTKLRLYLGQETASMMAAEDGARLQKDMVHNLKLFRDYTLGQNVEKFLVFNLHFCDLNPTVKMYDLLMREFLKAKFPGSQQPDLEQKWSRICWSCFVDQAAAVTSEVTSEVRELKSCTECKIAKYCGRECQKSDWKRHRILHKELERTKHVLSSS